jgi:CBS-domain-containing membrane protein
MKQVKDFMKKKLISVYPEEPLTTVWKLIFSKGIHSLPVVDKSGKIKGIIAEEDLLARVYPQYSEIISDLDSFKIKSLEKDVKNIKKLKAKDVMNKIVFSTSPESSIFKALSRMLMLQVRQLPVIDDKNKIVGLISKGDIFDHIFRDYLLNNH